MTKNEAENTLQPQDIIYHTTGGVLPLTVTTYVERPADRELEKHLEDGKFCHIFNSRQMGKSSLKLRTAARLEKKGFICAKISLQGIGVGKNTTEEFWYNTIAWDLAKVFDLEEEYDILWNSHPQFSFNQRLADFIDEILKRNSNRIVIFIDEIDMVLSLGDFTDNFFGLIRDFSEAQSYNSNYRRLSVVLIGVTTPGDLIKNKTLPPYNIGREIKLKGFKKDTLDLLSVGLGRADNKQAIGDIHYWTNGQPFLTQKLCQLAVDFPDESIADIVYSKIVENWKSQDKPPHFKTISNNVLIKSLRPAELLQRYRQIWKGNNVDSTEEDIELRLSGLVVEDDNGKLQVSNRICKWIFNLDWIDRELANICPHSPSLLAWIDAGQPPGELLLRGDALKEAIEWRDSQTGTISHEHNIFLGKSQKAKDDRDLAKADRDLRKEQDTIKQLIKILTSLAVLVGLLLIFVLGIQKINELNSTSNQIMQQYEFAPIASLKAAIDNANNFENNRPLLLGHSTSAPQLALQKLVDSIQETSEFNTYQGGINSIAFCQDGRILTAGSNGTINLIDKNGKLSKTFKLESRAKINSISTNSECKDIFASGSSDGKVNLWKWDRDKPIDEISAHEETVKKSDNDAGVENVVLTADSKYIFSTGTTDGKLKKWEIKNDKSGFFRNDKPMPFTFDDDGIIDVAHKDGVISLKINRNNEIGTSGKDNTAKIWNLDGKLIQKLDHKVFTRKDGFVNSIHFCSTKSDHCDKFKVATGSNDGVVRLWNIKENKYDYMTKINAHLGEVKAVRFSPDGQLLATSSANDPSASNGSSVRIWDLTDKEPKLVTEFKGHQGSIESIRFNPNFNESKNRTLVTSGHEDSMIRIWKIPMILDSKDKHQEKINSVRFDPTDSTHFFTAGEDGKIGWWSHQVGALPKLIDKFEDSSQVFTSIRIHPILGNQAIAVSNSKGMIRLFKIEGEKIKEFGSFDTHQGRIESIDWNSTPYEKDQYLLAATGSKSSLKVWNIALPNGTAEKFPMPPIIDKEHQDYSGLILRFSQDGKNLLLGGDNGQVILIDNFPKKPTVHHLKLDNVKTNVTVGFNPDSKSFTIVSNEGEIWQSDLSPKLLKSEGIRTYQAGTKNIAISSTKNGDIATGGASAALRLWDRDGHQLADFKGYWGTIRSINFSKDGKYLLAGGDDGVPTVWRIDRTISELIEQGEKLLKQ
jgi:WD40 repeat protein